MDGRDSIGDTGGGDVPAASKQSLPSTAANPKILSRNTNGTLVLTSSPNNEAELQLYRVMQRASLLAYYDTLLEMGGDDVQQLCEAGEEEFLEIMALVGMASKPLHVRRLQKALQEWVTNPAMFQTPLVSSPNSFSPLASIRPMHVLPGVSTPGSSASHTPCVQPTQVSPGPTKDIPTARSPGHTHVSASATHQQHPRVQTCVLQGGDSAGNRDVRGPSPGPPGSPIQLTPVLVESQISRLADAAEALVKTLPQFEPKPHNTKKKMCRDLELVMNMAEEDPRRMEEIRKYAAIYGRFDCKRKPEKPLTLHEVSVNEAAAQICRFCPALLTRRDELFPLARQVVRDSGYHYTKTQPSTTPLCRSYQYQHGRSEDSNGVKRMRLSPSPCESADLDRVRRQERLEQIAEELRVLGERTEELVQAAQQVRETNDLSSIHSLQLQMEVVQAKQTQLLMEQSDLLKQPLPMRFYRRSSRLPSCYNDSEKADTDDTDSQFSISNASSPSQEVGDSRDSLLRDNDNASSNSNGAAVIKSPGKASKQFAAEAVMEEMQDLVNHQEAPDGYERFYHDNKVQVIAASGGNIIAVANPALSMSTTILPHTDNIQLPCFGPDSPLSLKIERQSPKKFQISSSSGSLFDSSLDMDVFRFPRSILELGLQWRQC